MDNLEKEKILNEFVGKSAKAPLSFNIHGLFEKKWHFILFYQSLNILMLILSIYIPFLILLFVFLNGVAVVALLFISLFLKFTDKTVLFFIFGILSLLIPTVYFNILKINKRNIFLFFLFNTLFLSVALLFVSFIWAGLMRTLM
jgi:hypothetical protein